jgi:hypothetical protein
MFDMHKKLNQFYDDHVRLGEERQTLAKHRDANLDRLKAGLEKLEYPSSFDYRNQGSYAMHTINQHPEKDYDIDVAIIFAKDDLPSSALDARKRIEEAMREGGGNFSQPPEAKTNAVRVYYAEGHHIDLAIYRQYEDGYGNPVCEHAGSDWTSRDPMEITNWFNTTVCESSPSKEQGATVDKNQMRRVVRWLKAFAKSRESWDLPGGLIISVLVAECYRRDFYRDDVCLYNTMVSIRDRLQMNEDVSNPVDAAQTLTNRPVDVGRVRRFRDKLDSAISQLAVLQSSDCTEEQATKAWYWVFQHPFWSADDATASKSMAAYGELLGEAARQGAVFVTSAGRVSTEEPEERHVRAPAQRFYGSS